MDFYLGVDAGGTKTRAVLADAFGRLCAVGKAGPGNWQAIGAPAAGQAISRAVEQALAATEGEVAREALRGSFFALAGVRVAEERAVMAAEVAKLRLPGAVELGGDLTAAHAGALAGGPGVVVIAGTGSAAWGVNAAGESWQAGGWGWLVDDQGGAYWLALRGLAAACEAEDGRGPVTQLGARAAAYFGASGLREVLRDLHSGRRDRAAVAGFAREVRAAADATDLVACGLVEAAGAELLRLAEAVRARLSPADGGRPGRAFPFAVTGGLGMGAVVRERALAAGFKPVEPWGEPVLGALLLAARAGGAELDAAARVRLLAGWKTPQA